MFDLLDDLSSTDPAEQKVIALLKNYPFNPPSLPEALIVSRNLFEASLALPEHNKFRGTAMYLAQECFFYVVGHLSDSEFAASFKSLLNVTQDVMSRKDPTKN